jgi:hypothetical protein
LGASRFVSSRVGSTNSFVLFFQPLRQRCRSPIGQGGLWRAGESGRVLHQCEARDRGGRCIGSVGPYSLALAFLADNIFPRLLAHAGYDARKAVTFWENRSSADCSSGERKESPSSSFKFVHNITGSKHPVSEVRVNSLKGELLRWETERRAQLRRQEVPREDSHIVLATA